MKLRKKLLLLILIICGGLFLTSCDMTGFPVNPSVPIDPERKVVSIAVNDATIPDQSTIADFEITSGDLIVYYDDGLSSSVDMTVSMIGADDLLKLNTLGTHNITVNYQGLTTVFTIELISDGTEPPVEDIDAKIEGVMALTTIASSTSDNFTLPSSRNNVTITWSSNLPNISISGTNAIVTRNETADVSVTLTATFTYKEVTKTKTYQVVVLKKPVVDNTGNYDGNYYNGFNLDLVGTALKTALRKLLQDTHHTYTSYSDCKYNLPSVDEDLNNAGKMILFYTGQSIQDSYDLNNDWNREHVWAQSLGWFGTSGAGSDLHHIRPCNISVNSSRGNKKFGTASGYYEPTDAYKGDVARIIFYLMIAYSEADSYSFTSIAQSKAMLLEWNRIDPVDAGEIYRNDAVEDIQGNRNPFIDYPYLADSIWG